jgi:hypothetical protein
MRTELEFHDSKIVSMSQAGGAIEIALDGYVHRWDKSSGAWKGEGWRRPVLLAMTGELKLPPTLVSDVLETGEIQAGELTHTHLVALPFSAAGPATLRLETLEGEVLEFSGADLTIVTTGEGAFVEKLPDAFKPVG